MAMPDEPVFSVESAREAAEHGHLADWVGRFLASPGSDNAVLATQLPEELGGGLAPLSYPSINCIDWPGHRATRSCAQSTTTTGMIGSGTWTSWLRKGGSRRQLSWLTATDSSSLRTETTGSRACAGPVDGRRGPSLDSHGERNTTASYPTRKVPLGNRRLAMSRGSRRGRPERRGLWQVGGPITDRDGNRFASVAPSLEACPVAHGQVCGWFGLHLPRVQRLLQTKGGFMVGAGGLVASIIAFVVGAVLDWAVTEPNQHGFNVNKVGWILMIVGVVGAVVSIIVMVAANTRRRRTIVDDGQGNMVRRVDSTY